MAKQKSIASVEYREIHRSQIQTAKYNPRVINEYQRGNLKRSLKTYGLVELLIWNEKTGTLVSGHQRLSILDEEHGTLDYTVGVSVVNLSEKRERELNVILNNRQAQGDFDISGLTAMMAEGLDLDAVMISTADFDSFVGDTSELEKIMADLKNAEPQKAEPKPKEKLNKNEIRKAAADAEENDSEYYLVVSWPCTADLVEWLKAKKLPLSTRHIGIGELEALLAS